eukprot:TRINITY_DN124_c0_g1_i1.p1 TRINITY_DN124_c0_g1~~TRINITY_DN124_c0_g1_i1.p1  ORF type:complete len:157 (+),score=11.04 TRINITY_DN124_c0_g1_i1:228-698(+)
MDSFKRLVSGEQKEPSLMDDLNEQFSLTYQQRAIGWVICAGVGLLLDFLGFIFLLNPGMFALLYTLGNITMLCSTAFIVGPMKQVKNMCKPTRIICMLIFLLSMALTLAGVFEGWPTILIILLVLFQFCALLYYCFSYIPYGRQCLRGICGRVVAV